MAAFGNIHEGVLPELSIPKLNALNGPSEMVSEGACSADMYPLSPSSGVCAQFLLYWLISEQFTSFTIEHEGHDKPGARPRTGFLSA